MRRSLVALAWGVLLSSAPALLPAQESPVRRVANIVSVAVEEYNKGVDATGRIVLAIEYQEATDFLADARGQAERLSGEGAVAARAILDSIIVAVENRVPPDQVKALEQRFSGSLGSEAALEMPSQAINLAEGRDLYAQNCASCHGVSGQGDGPAARGMEPPPPALGDAATMRDVTPALMYRISSVGIAGTPMVGFAGSLTPEQRWNIVSYLVSLHASRGDVAEGEGLFVQRCQQCHGPLGTGSGTASATLSRLPPDIGSFSWQATKHSAELADVVRRGLAGTAMPPGDMTETQALKVVAYLRSMSLQNTPVLASTTQQRRDDPALASRDVLALLDQSLTAARLGRTSEAGDRAFDAYIAFEPMESRARSRGPGLVANMEKLFADFRGAVRAGDLRAAERAQMTIQAQMPSVLELTRPLGSGIEAFWQSFMIIFREGLEAILVIGAIVTFLIKTGHRERLRSIWIGIALALVASAATAVVLMTVLAAMPATREVIEGVTMLIAVAVLFSVSYWLISKVEAAKWQQFIREKVTAALEHGGGRALMFVAFLAVYREGAETALFYQALFNEGARVALPISMGILVGGAVLAVIFTLFYRFGIRIPLRPMFTATSVLLYYMAFVFMGKGLRELQEGNALTITVIPGGPYVEFLGIFPTVETLSGQVLLLVLFVFALVKTFWPKRSVALPTVAADPTATALVEAQIAEMRAAQNAMEARLEEIEATLGRERSELRSGD